MKPLNAKRNEKGEVYIKDVIVLPDLHMTLGVVNDTWNNLEARCPQVMKSLEKKIGVQKSEYQGKRKYEGNQCAKILQKVNIIEADLPEQFHDFIEIFDGINEVRSTTYGNTLSYCSPRPAPYFQNVVKQVALHV